jgi:hypothetical protein
LRISAATAIDRATAVQISLHFVLFNLDLRDLDARPGHRTAPDRKTLHPCALPWREKNAA